jgi:hypothetical protein
MIQRLKVFTATLMVGCALMSAGCAAPWINEPSPQVRGLVNDLKLEGYECKARLEDIVCRQGTPYRQKQPKLCDSKTGCVAQADLLVYNVYFLAQQGNGIPRITQEVERKRDDAFVQP